MERTLTHLAHGGAFGFFVFLALVFSILLIVGARIVYSDASRNSSGNAFLRGLVAISGGIVDLLLCVPSGAIG